MAWTIDYQADSRVVELRFVGRTSGADLQEAAASRIEFGRHKWAQKYLVDAAEIQTPKSVIVDVLEILSKYYVDSHMDITSRIAIIQPKDAESRWVAKFYENASVMRGWSVDIFPDRRSAVAWLHEHDSERH